MKTATMIPWSKIPKSYAQLVALHAPRPIHDKTGAAEAAAIMDAMAGHKLNRDQEDYFNLLCQLYEAWENTVAPTSRAPAHEVLDLVLKARDENPADLAQVLGVDRSLGYRLIKGTRHLTAEHVVVAAAYYGLDPVVLLPLVEPMKLPRIRKGYSQVSTGA